MTRVLFCVVPEMGHLNPCIGPAQQLRAAGLDVVFYAPSDIRAQLAAAGGFDFVGPDTPTERHDLSRGASFAAHVRDPDWLHAWIRALLIEEPARQVDGLRALLREQQPAVVVIDPLLYAAAIAAECEGIPWVALSNSLNPVLPEDMDSDLLRTVRALAPARDALFAGYGVSARFRGCDVLSPYLTLALTTEALVGPAPVGVHLVGPALPVSARGDESDFPWERLHPGLPLVYLSLGSQLYYQPELFGKLDAAVRALAVQLVMSVGELDGAEQMPALSRRVIAVRYTPQLEVLARADLFITHGGANSVMEALAAGVPMLVSPICNDQFHTAHFVVQAGAARRIDLFDASVEEIRDAIQTALGDEVLYGRAATMKASYAQDGSAQAARLIAQLAANRLGVTEP